MLASDVQRRQESGIVHDNQHLTMIAYTQKSVAMTTSSGQDAEASCSDPPPQVGTHPISSDVLHTCPAAFVAPAASATPAAFGFPFNAEPGGAALPLSDDCCVRLHAW